VEYYALAVGPFFSDAHLVMRGDADGPASRVSSSFRLSLLLSALAAAGLVAGLSLALRGASQAVRLSRARTDFVSNVSHELRTPLSSIRVLAEFLAGGRVGDPAKVVEYGRLIETEARRMMGLVETVLDFARLEADRRPPALEAGRLEEVVAETVAAFAPRAREAGFDLVLDGGDGRLPGVLLDRRQLGEAVANLVDNAIKYSGEARRVVVRLAGDDREARVSVEDRGIGIPTPEQRRIFEKFYRVGGGPVHDVKGAGLGLARVEHVVKGHRGRVTVRSQPGEGSTFTIHLPAAEAGR